MNEEKESGKDEGQGRLLMTVLALVFFLPMAMVTFSLMAMKEGASLFNRSVCNYLLKGEDMPFDVPEEEMDFIDGAGEGIGLLGSIWSSFYEEDEEDTDEEQEELMKAVYYTIYCKEDGDIDLEDLTTYAEVFYKHSDLEDIYDEVSDLYDVELSDTDKAGIGHLWNQAVNGAWLPVEGDSNSVFGGWQMRAEIPVYSLSENGIGGEAVNLAATRVGDPYSMELRGIGRYVDCSYLVYWVYHRLGVELPYTAAEQGRYIVNHNLSIAREDLMPGDLIFWSYHPNDRYLNITHVGIYAGDGMIIDASFSHKEVMYRNEFDLNKQVLYGRVLVQNEEE